MIENQNQEDIDRKIMIDSSKKRASNRSVSLMKQCFHHKKHECKPPIIRAHTIQENGRLSLLEANVNGQNKIYSFSEIISNSKRYVNNLKPIGKGVASTFYGFCSYHDNELFKPIELHPYDSSDNEHNFLHSYRSFAFSQHTQQEDSKLLESKNRNDYEDSFLNGTLLGIQDGEKWRQELNAILDNGNFNKIYYHTRSFEGVRSIAVSSAVTPPFFYDNNSFNNHTDVSIPYSHIMLTIFPSAHHTNVILACLKEDRLGIKFLNQLRKLSNLKFQKAISSIVISNVENTFISPGFWNSLNKSKQNILLNELNFCIMENLHQDVNHSGFFHSEINFFSNANSAINL